MEEDQGKMQERLDELKKMLAKGERKLKRSVRKAKVKEHREKKIKEHNERLKECDINCRLSWEKDEGQHESKIESVLKTKVINHVSSAESKCEAPSRGNVDCMSSKRSLQRKTTTASIMYDGQNIHTLEEGSSKEHAEEHVLDNNLKVKLSKPILLIDEGLVGCKDNKDKYARIHVTVTPNKESLDNTLMKDQITDTNSVTETGKDLMSGMELGTAQGSSGEVSSRSSIESNSGSGRRQLSLKRKRKSTEESPVRSSVNSKENHYVKGCIESVICIDDSSKEDDDVTEEITTKDRVFRNTERNQQCSLEKSISDSDRESSTLYDTVDRTVENKKGKSKRQKTQNISPKLENKLGTVCVVPQKDYYSDKVKTDSVLFQQQKQLHSNLAGMKIKSNRLIMLSSALQYLIDDAKRMTSIKEFELPLHSYGIHMTKKLNYVRKQLGEEKKGLTYSSVLSETEDLQTMSRPQEGQSPCLISVKSDGSQASHTTECSKILECKKYCKTISLQKDSSVMIAMEDSQFSSSTQSSQSTLCEDIETICRKSSRRKKRGRKKASLQKISLMNKDTILKNSKELNIADEAQLNVKPFHHSNDDGCFPESLQLEEKKVEEKDPMPQMNTQTSPSSPTLFSQPDELFLAITGSMDHLEDDNHESENIGEFEGTSEDVGENISELQNDFGNDLLHLSSFRVATDDVIVMIKPVVMHQGKKLVDLVTCLTKKSLSIWLPEDFDLTCLQRWEFPMDFGATAGDVYTRKGSQVFIVILLENEEHKLLCSAVFEQDKAHSLADVKRWDSTSKYGQLVCCDSGMEFLVSNWSLEEGSSITKYILGSEGKQVSSLHDLAAISGVLDSISMVQNLPSAVIGHVITGVIHIWNHVLGTLLVSINIFPTWPHHSFLTSPSAEKGYILCCLMSKVPAESAGCHMVINPTNHQSAILHTFLCENWKGCTMAVGLEDSVVATDLCGCVLTWSRFNGALMSRSYKPRLTRICTTKHYVITAMDCCVHVFKR